MAVSDSLGRISLVDLVDLLVVRMFKGHSRPPARVLPVCSMPAHFRAKAAPNSIASLSDGLLDERLDCVRALRAVQYRKSQADSGTLEYSAVM